MKSRLIILSVLLSFSIVVQGQGYKISTKVINQNDTVAYLGHHFATQRYVDDTTKVVNGVAVFEGSRALPEGIYFYYTPTQYFEFLISSQEQIFSIEGTSPDIVGSAKITGSPVNEGFFEMQRFTSRKRKEANILRNSIDSTSVDAEQDAVRENLQAIDKEVKDFQKEIQQKYFGSILDRLIRLMQSPDVNHLEDDDMVRYHYFKAHYWDGIDISDSGLLRSPLLHNKIMDYLDNVVIQQVDTVIESVDELLTISEKSEEAFRYLLITLTNKYEASPVMGFDRVFVHIVDKYYATGKATWSDAETIQKLTDRVATMRPNFIGNQAPGFVMQDTLGTDHKLEDFKTRFTVLYFYDPDCGHCKKATPILYGMYPELQAKDVEILAICTTTDGKRWKEYVKENEFEWPNLADLDSKTYFKFFYDIRSTPIVYILDRDKKIVMKRIAVEDVSEIIDRLIDFEDNANSINDGK